MAWSTALLVLLAALVPPAAALTDCTDVLADSSEYVGSCSNKWHNLKPLLRPCQAEVGYAWVQRKYDKDFDDDDEAQDEMDGSPIPAVLGPVPDDDDDGGGGSHGAALYIVDHHHTLAALDFSGFDDVSVTVSIICDQRGLSYDAFASFMEDGALAFLLAHPSASADAQYEPISFSALPPRFSFTASDSSFADDPWRSLSSFSRKVENDGCAAAGYGDACLRCYDRACDTQGGGIPFFEFRWAYFFVDALGDASLWPDKASYENFSEAYKGLDAAAAMGSIDVDGWQAVAGLLVPLCRDAAAGEYELPEDAFAGGGGLPGYAEGFAMLDDDPDCAAPDGCGR